MNEDSDDGLPARYSQALLWVWGPDLEGKGVAYIQVQWNA